MMSDVNQAIAIAKDACDFVHGSSNEKSDKKRVLIAHLELQKLQDEKYLQVIADLTAENKRLRDKYERVCPACEGKLFCCSNCKERFNNKETADNSGFCIFCGGLIYPSPDCPHCHGTGTVPRVIVPMKFANALVNSIRAKGDFMSYRYHKDKDNNDEIIDSIYIGENTLTRLDSETWELQEGEL